MHSLELNYNCPHLGNIHEVKNRLLNSIGTITELISEFSDICISMAEHGICPRLDLESSGKNGEILMQFDEMPTLSELVMLPKNCTNSRFFEALSEQSRVHGIRAQKKIAQINNMVKQRINNNLTRLGLDYALNSDLIHQEEKLLSNILDQEVRDRLRDLKIFEILNSEWACPHFLDLCKKTAQDEKLSDICDDNGNIKLTGNDLQQYITNFYSSLYRIDNSVRGEIEDFLGHDISNHPLVRGSILTPDEKIKLDRELNITELDLSLEQSNMKSSPGMDGFSYTFIKKCWNIYREPLFMCAKESLENQTLPDVFLSAQIKLIPKKGDSSKIGNWRPISLLSNFYKIISRLINNRIKEVANRILSRTQKGFNNKRVIQESILNIVENMDFCKRENIKGAMVSIDESKAFDSVSHSYMEKVYTFFGMGDCIQRWLKSIGTGRSACIIMGPGELSDTFPLEKGHAQGDSPSPLLYNFVDLVLQFVSQSDTTCH